MSSIITLETESQSSRSWKARTSKFLSQYMPSAKIRSRVFWAVFGNLSRAVTQSVFLIALVRFTSVETAGKYALALAITAPMFVFLNLGLRQLQGTDTTEEYEFSDYLGLRTIAITLGMLTLLAVLLASNHSAESSRIILAVACCRLLEAVGDTFYGLFQKHEQHDRIAWSEGSKSLLSLGVFILILATTKQALLAIASIVVVRVVLLMVQELRWTCYEISIRPRFRLHTLSKLCRMAIPLGSVAMFVSLATNSPRYFLAEAHGEVLVGIYAIMELFLQMVQTVTISVQQATSANLSRSYRASLPNFYCKLGKLVIAAILWGASATLAVYLLGPWLLGLCLGTDASDYRLPFMVLMCSSLALNSRCFFSAAMVIMRRTRTQAILTGVSLLFTFATGYLLIPTYELMGAAFTVLLSGIMFSTLMAMAVLFVKKEPAAPMVPEASTGTIAISSRSD